MPSTGVPASLPNGRGESLVDSAYFVSWNSMARSNDSCATLNHVLVRFSASVGARVRCARTEPKVSERRGSALPMFDGPIRASRTNNQEYQGPCGTR